MGSVADRVSKEDEWYRLFDMFGVHYPTKMYFGAKYGLTTYMSQGSYATVTQKSSAFSVGAEVTKKVEVNYKKMSKVKASVTVGAEYGEKSSQGISKNNEQLFQEEKEYSLGKRLPADGSVEDWIKDLDAEPMPTRYGLKSICNHPALAPKKADCEKYADSYCCCTPCVVIAPILGNSMYRAEALIVLHLNILRAPDPGNLDERIKK